MRITGVKFNTGRGNTILTIRCTSNSLRINALLGVIYQDKEYCFKVNSIEAKTGEGELTVTAGEIGYYNLFSKTIFSDYREILELKPYFITDKEKIKMIEKESCYI